MQKNSNQQFQKIARAVRLSVLEMIMNIKGPHIGSSFSVVDILVALYFKVMNIDPTRPNDVERDRLILSKGHAAAALYATLAEKGFFNKKLLEQYCVNGSTLPGHASYNCVPGVEASTGSLGHGLPIANGMALAVKQDGLGRKIFVLLSDGECDEGSVWEAALFAGHHRLDNLVAIVDYNKWQSFGRVKEVLNLEPFVEKWQDFGWSVKEVDGHNFDEILGALAKIPFDKDKPSVIIAHTIKGKGLPFEDTLESHYRPPTAEEYELAKQKIMEL